ncbi:MAG: NAD-dependent epimerase/dehydratase family protein [Verrucomicrobia bacterium]|nr:NAD-dependent epimerase/dehydratase family protein [Verrucomicrobiota bacterium]
MKRILITGGAGFVGSSLALSFRKNYPEAEVIALDNLYRKGAELNRKRIEAAGITFIQADVRNRSAFEMAPCDLILDAAAEPSVLAGQGGDAAYVVDTNLVGTLHALEAARRWDAAFLFLSTSRVYPVARLCQIRIRETATRFELDSDQDCPGCTVHGIGESFPLDGARTLYGATKFAAEIMVAEYASQFQLRALIDRCGVIAGPWQMGRVDQGVIALWVAAHHYGRPLKYIGFKGKQVRDCLHIDDLGDLICHQTTRFDLWNGSAYNIGGGRATSTSLLELTQSCRAATGQVVSITTDDQQRPGDVPIYITDTRHARDVFDWSPKRNMDTIVHDTARWIRENAATLREVFA